MSMFDSYVPEPMLKCPVCGTDLRDWQGKDGPNLLLVWRQGVRRPQPTDLEVAVNHLSLPPEFLLRSSTCQCFGNGIEAVGRCIDGVWSETQLLTADLVEHFYYWQPKAWRAALAARLRDAGL
jgi:hypothetical protein